MNLNLKQCPPPSTKISRNLSENSSQRIDFQFRLLYAIAIVFVVAGHAGNGGINIFFDWFTPYAFHLGIFAFGSGYFYKVVHADNQVVYLKRKIKRLIIPFFLCNTFYGFLILVMRPLGMAMGSEMNLSTLIIEPLQHGHQFVYNLGTWFVIPLFVVEIFNNILNKFLGFLKKIRILIIFIIYLILGALSVSMAQHGWNTGWFLLLTRSMFLLPIFGLGMLYREYRMFDCINSWIFIGFIMFLQYLLLLYYNGPRPVNICWMTGFEGGVLLPFCLEFLGIFFWLRISALLTPIAQKSKVIAMIGAHTFEIMAHHLIAMVGLKAIFAMFALLIPMSFDFQLFTHNIWYYYCPKGIWQTHFFYVIVGVTLPLIYVALKQKVIAKLSLLFRDR